MERGTGLSTADEVIRLFEEQGQAAYFGENVSVLEHSLQTAYLARQAKSPDALTVAALVHDIGHLLHGMGEDIASHGVDGRHEIAGEAWLATRFGPEVTEPVRLHVDAKRYLCRVDADYLSKLSAASTQSLKLQGGPYSEAEARAFESNLWYQAAVALRRWDDTAKIQGLTLPGLETYRELLRNVSTRG
jgi:phosphonate degradation associated HDIG domain protein